MSDGPYVARYNNTVLFRERAIFLDGLPVV
jgi:hypothetical protein